jgi:cytochrome P450
MIFAINGAHRDPAVYDRPDEFDITRNVMPTVSFEQGPHSCVGNWLANTELIAALRLLVRRLPDLAVQAHTSTITSQFGTTLTSRAATPGDPPDGHWPRTLCLP